MLQTNCLGRAKRIWYLSPMQAAKVQASLRIRAVSPEPSLLAHTSSESRGTFNQKARSLVPLNGWACAVKICHDGMLEDTNSLDGARFKTINSTNCIIDLTVIVLNSNKGNTRPYLKYVNNGTHMYYASKYWINRFKYPHLFDDKLSTCHRKSFCHRNSVN